MKTLIAYSTKYGATEECAKRIAKRLPGNTDLRCLDGVRVDSIDPLDYDQVVIGCSVYMGKPRKPARQFCQHHLQALLKKRTGLYLCCIQDIDRNVMQQLSLAYPKELIEHAAAMEQLGGVVDFTKLGRMDRFIMNLIAGDLRKKTGDQIISTLSDSRIKTFCDRLLAAPDPSEAAGEELS